MRKLKEKLVIEEPVHKIDVSYKARGWHLRSQAVSAKLVEAFRSRSLRNKLRGWHLKSQVLSTKTVEAFSAKSLRNKLRGWHLRSQKLRGWHLRSNKLRGWYLRSPAFSAKNRRGIQCQVVKKHLVQ